MITGFSSYLRRHTKLEDADIACIANAARPMSLRRHEHLLQEGEICRHKTFVLHGLLRTYGVHDDGSEHILQFAPENTWTLDAESYDRQQPSGFHIAATEPSDLLRWSKATFDQLLQEIPLLSLFAQQLISRNVHSSRQRLFTALSASPEEKYNDFIQHYPGLLHRLPLHMIAAYLGISLKTLTRIRHSRWQQTENKVK